MSFTQGPLTADTIRARLTNIDHQICEGIRHGDIAEVMWEIRGDLVSQIKNDMNQY